MKAGVRPLPQAWQSVRWPTQRAQDWTYDLVAKNGDRLVVIAIGSAVRGCARPGSDLDLVVVHRGERPGRRPPPEVEVRWVGANEAEACLADGDDVLAWAVAFGVPLHDPEGVWARIAEGWRDRLPLPSIGVSAQRECRARCLAQDMVAAGDDDAAAEQVLSMLTHRARRLLAQLRIFPRSRPELAEQLRLAGENETATLLDGAIRQEMTPNEILAASE